MRFAAFLRQRLAEGAISDPYIEEILRLELAVNDLRWNRDPPVRIVRFRHSPEPLLAALAEGRRPIGEDIPAGNDYFLVLDARSGEIEFTRIDGHVPKAFTAFNGAAKSGR